MTKLSKFIIAVGWISGWAGVYLTYVRNNALGEIIFGAAILLLVINHIRIWYQRDSDKSINKSGLVLSYLSLATFFIGGAVGSVYYGFWEFLLKK